MASLSGKLKRLFGVVAYGAGVVLNSVSLGEGVLGEIGNLAKGVGTEFISDVAENDFESFGKWVENHQFYKNFAQKLKGILDTPELVEVVKDIVKANSKKPYKNQSHKKLSGRSNKDGQDIDFKARDVAMLSRIWLCQYNKDNIKQACQKSEKFTNLSDKQKAIILEFFETSCSIYLEDAYDGLEKEDYKVLASVIIRSLGSQISALQADMKAFAESHPVNADQVTLNKATVQEILYEAYTLKCPFCGNVDADTLSDSGNHKYKCDNCETFFFCGPASSLDEKELESFISDFADRILNRLSSLIEVLDKNIKENFNRLSEKVSSEGEKTRVHGSREHEITRAEIKQTALNAKDLLREALREEFIEDRLIGTYSETVIKYYPNDMLANFTLKFLSKQKLALAKFINNISINDENISDVDIIINVLLRYAEKRFLVALNSLVERTYMDRDPDKYSEYNDKINTISKKLDGSTYIIEYKRDVFIAYSSKDIGFVDELVYYLEEHDPRTKFNCFVAHRNLPHCRVDYYDTTLQKAMENCSAFIFVSTKNSRDGDCDAIKELKYFVDNKPTATRIEYLVENYDNPLCWIDNYVKQLFDGIEYCVKGSYDALVQRLLSAKFSSTNNASSEQAVQFTKDPVLKPTEEKPPKAEISKNAAPLHLSASSCPNANSSQSPDGYRDNDFIRNAQIENGVLIKYKGTAKEIVIPDSVTSIGKEAFSWCESLTSITIPDSVTNIGVRTFASCKALASITVDSNNKVYRSENNCIIERKSNTLIAGCYNSVIPKSVTSIGNWAFEGCTSLTSITIPDSVTSIGIVAFRCCKALASITIPNSVTSIGLSAFHSCTSLTSITIPDSVTSIGEWAFEGCTSLTSITIPKSVKSIGEWAFAGCNALASITVDSNNKVYRSENNCIIVRKSNTLIAGCYNSVIPDSVISIGEGAFEGCTSLTSITIPKFVKSIGEWAFAGCNALASITVDSNNKVYRSENNCIIERKSNTLIAGCYNSVIPDSVTSIGEGAFEGCTSLASITIPDSVTSIGDGAFAGCKTLASIAVDINNKVYRSENNCIIERKSNTLIAGCYNSVIPKSVKKIGGEAFSGCVALASIIIPDSVTSIGNWAFSLCTSLTSITIPDSVTSIGMGAFRSCTSLTSISIPKSVTSIGEWAFEDCKSLEKIYYTGTKAQWAEIDIAHLTIKKCRMVFNAR